MTDQSSEQPLSGPGAGLSATGPEVPGDAVGSDYGDAGGDATAEDDELADGGSTPG